MKMVSMFRITERGRTLSHAELRQVVSKEPPNNQLECLLIWQLMKRVETLNADGFEVQAIAGWVNNLSADDPTRLQLEIGTLELTDITDDGELIFQAIH